MAHIKGGTLGSAVPRNCLLIVIGHLLLSEAVVRCWDPAHTGMSPGSGHCYQSDMGHVLLALCASVSPTVNGNVEALASWSCVRFLAFQNIQSVTLI